MTLNLISWADGKKTYLTVALGLGLGVYQAITGVDISTHWYVAVVLTALGFNRLGLAKTQASTTAATEAVQSFYELLEAELAKPQESAVGASQASSEQTVVIGQPTPANLNEEEVTAALNKLQTAK